MSSPELGALDADQRRALLTALVRDYAQREGGGPPLLEGVLSVDEVAKTVAAMMRSAGVTSFELAALFDV